MGLLRPLEKPEHAYFKAAFFGAAGTGKTYTASSVALGLHQHIGSTKPIAFLDTETGSDPVLSRFQAAGVKLLVAKTRAFKDLTAVIAEAQGECDILIVDSLSHFWDEWMTAYRRKVGRQRLAFHDWGPIKEQWALGYTQPYLASNLHIIVCQREQNVYDTLEEEDEESGKTTYTPVKRGVRPRGEGESAYEPSLLVAMHRVYLEKEQQGVGDSPARQARRATVIKDRWSVLDGAVFDDPTFEDFLPTVKMLALGETHSAVDFSRTSDALAQDDQKSVAILNKRRRIAWEEFCGLLASAWPSTSAHDKKMKLDYSDAILGTRSAEKAEGLPPQVLEQGVAWLRLIIDTEAHQTDCTAAEVVAGIQARAAEERAAEADGAGQPALPESSQ